MAIKLLADLTPLQALTKLESLEFHSSGLEKGKLHDLRPLRGLKLKRFSCCYTHLDNLAPLKGMPLEVLGVSMTGTTSLEGLRGLRLRTLSCGFNPITDLSPLRDMTSLEELNCEESLVDDLEPLRGLKLIRLNCFHCRLENLNGLEGMKSLESLDCRRAKDYSALRGLPLRDVRGYFEPARDTEIVRSLPKVETINGKPAAEFWKEFAQDKKPE